MTIPLIAFLYLYLLFVLAWLAFSLIAFYHLARYGQTGLASLSAISAYLAASMIILYLSYQYLSQIDWEVGLTVFQGGFNLFGSNNF